MKRCRIAAMAFVALAVAAGARATLAAPRDEPLGRTAVGSARESFERAVALQRAAHRALGDERRELLLKAARTYQSLRSEHPEAVDAVAEGGLRAAGLFASLGAEDCALEEYQAVCALATPARWRARAWLERGHLERRANRLAPALDAYLRAASVDGGARRTRDEAALWAAKTQLLARDIEPARRLLAWIVEHTPDPFARVRAYDEWALSFVRVDDLAAAAGVLELCRSSTREQASEATPRGRRLLLALERMRCIAALERAVREGKRARAQE